MSKVSNQQMGDVELVERARQGDAAAFGELVERHWAVVYRTAWAALRLHADAEDAAQEAFLIAHQRLGAFRGEASFKSWLLAITWHLANRRRRGLVRWWRRTAEDAHHDDERADRDLHGLERSPEELFAGHELQQA